MVTTHAFRTKPLCLEVINGWLLSQLRQAVSAAQRAGELSIAPSSARYSICSPISVRQGILHDRDAYFADGRFLRGLTFGGDRRLDDAH
jgi:hypothetical protein